MLEVITLLSALGMPEVDRGEVYCLAQTVYHEARGEPILGQIAVAHVTMNRVHDDSWPGTVCEVVTQPHQFEWVGKGLPVLEHGAWKQSVEIATLAYLDYVRDQTEGATYFYNPREVQPEWAVAYTPIGIIGEHMFLTE